MDAVYFDVYVVTDPVHEAVPGRPRLGRVLLFATGSPCARPISSVAIAITVATARRRCRVRLFCWLKVKRFDEPDVHFVDDYLDGCFLDIGEGRDVDPQPRHQDRLEDCQLGIGAQDVIEEGAVEVDVGDLPPTSQEVRIDLIAAKAHNDGR